MKQKHLALFLSMIASTPALAAPVVMVQFGSFETQQEAQKRIDDLKSANGALISGISPAVREVKLPPDNLTVYRTQAGPLESRTVAQSLCNKLASSGSECYVVETAVNGTAPAAPVAKAEEKPATPVAAVPVAAVAAAVAESKPSTDMQAALDRAVTLQNSGAVAPQAVAVAPVEKPSFWSRLNPFSSSEPKPAAVAPKPVVVAEKPIAAPVTEVTTASLAPIEKPVVVASGSASGLTDSSSALTAKPVVTPAPVAVSTPVAQAPITLASSNELRPRLLPPPAPLTEKDKLYLETAPAPVARKIPAADIAAAPLHTAPVVKSEPLIALAPAAGTVNVEEAKRVPVTEAQAAPQGAVGAVMIPPAVNPLPSSTLGQRTLWAQVGQFTSSEAALDFWDNYRRQHPDFPALRVRVVSSMQQQLHGNERVWLRVGPFAQDGFIRSLCGSIGQVDKRCGRVVDIGTAAKANYTQVGYLQGSRYKR